MGLSEAEKGFRVMHITIGLQLLLFLSSISFANDQTIDRNNNEFVKMDDLLVANGSIDLEGTLSGNREFYYFYKNSEMRFKTANLEHRYICTFKAVTQSNNTMTNTLEPSNSSTRVLSLDTRNGVQIKLNRLTDRGIYLDLYLLSQSSGNGVHVACRIPDLGKPSTYNELKVSDLKKVIASAITLDPNIRDSNKCNSEDNIRIIKEVGRKNSI